MNGRTNLEVVYNSTHCRANYFSGACLRATGQDYAGGEQCIYAFKDLTRCYGRIHSLWSVCFWKYS